MDAYTPRMEDAMDMLGDVDPAVVESAGGELVRRHSSKGANEAAAGGGEGDEPEGIFAPAQAGYYPELADRVSKLKLESGLAGLLGDARELPDHSEAAAAKRQQLHAGEAPPPPKR